ncbi:hypothetical protein HYPSUDRAFT_59054 [Hypholoma sublateritium FD-334 SS-4]|uniref:F-box domain-containing protein n=1 Tax=Hypholoma sublateritium (strain FD-334 SS-4) TaxID=945553 RepID=A0A0D2P372_HYPSF|nr:hypothetical protein HYPSUDRAFT_59054 [Hypholoma sublateritium FD-334 SS-4]
MTHLDLGPRDDFPDFLRTEDTGITSLSMNGVKFSPEEIDAMASSGRLLIGLLGVTSLKIENMTSFPWVILISCVMLKKVEIRNVDFPNAAWKSSHHRRRPRLQSLTCTRLQETTVLSLLAIVDVAGLRYLEYELAPEELDGAKGLQHILDLCGNTLQSLTLHSPVSFLLYTGDDKTVCDLSQQFALKRLVFISAFYPELEAADDASPRLHVLSPMLSTISRRSCVLELIECKISIPLDVENMIMLRSRRKFPWPSEYPEPIQFFRQQGWTALDISIARVASVHPMRVFVNVTGVINEAMHWAYNPARYPGDNFTMRVLMDHWGKQTFVAVRELQNVDFEVDVNIQQLPLSSAIVESLFPSWKCVTLG